MFEQPETAQMLETWDGLVKVEVHHQVNLPMNHEHTSTPQKKTLVGGGEGGANSRKSFRRALPPSPSPPPL